MYFLNEKLVLSNFRKHEAEKSGGVKTLQDNYFGLFNPYMDILLVLTFFLS